jgi:hypothetical protein
MAVAGAFPHSWSLMLGLRNWWPATAQIECRRLQREAGSLAEALRSDQFVDALSRSLRVWRAFRGVRFDIERVKASLLAVRPLLSRWEAVSILTLRTHSVEGLFELFDAVRDIKPTARKWVVASKTLHHLLPDLIVPMDNLMTAPFLGRGSLPATLEASFLVQAYSAFIDLGRHPAHGIGARQMRAAARAIPYPIPRTAPLDCRIGLARVIDFAIAGFVMDQGRAKLISL